MQTQSIDIRELRRRLGWSQGKLADYLGVRQASVSRMENGQRLSGPALKLIEQLEKEAASAA